MIWCRSMKERYAGLASVYASRFPGWGPGDSAIRCLRTLSQMAQNTSQWRSCCNFRLIRAKITDRILSGCIFSNWTVPSVHLSTIIIISLSCTNFYSQFRFLIILTFVFLSLHNLIFVMWRIHILVAPCIKAYMFK